MTFLQAQTNLYLQMDENGDLVFYPRASFGRGYIVPNASVLNKITKRTRNFFVMFFSILVASVILSILSTIFSLLGDQDSLSYLAPLMTIPAFIHYHISTKKIVRELTPSPRRFNSRESLKISARSQNIHFLIFGIIFSATMTFICVFAFAIAALSKQDVVISLIPFGGIFLFSFFFIRFATMISINIQYRKRSEREDILNLQD